MDGSFFWHFDLLKPPQPSTGLFLVILHDPTHQPTQP